MENCSFFDACSACQALDKALSRCSQCKWAAYCSKTCQREHWKAGHRQMCATLGVVQRFRHLERQWWASRPPDELQTFVVQVGLQPESMSFFGEVLFLLCGLKACVLLSNLPPTWRRSFAEDVVAPSGLVQCTGSCSVGLFSVGSRLQTRAEYELTDDLVLANTQHTEFRLAERTLRLAAATTDANANLPLAGMVVSGLVEEHELAKVLNYPVALSECNANATMIEVGYFLEEGQKQVLLASYCAMVTPEHTRRVQQHFQQYQTDCAGIQLVLRKSQI